MHQKRSNPVLVEVATVDIAEIHTDTSNNNHRSLVSRRSFNADELIIEFSAKSVQPTPSYLTVQLEDREHIELFPEFLECINHSCEPNCFFDTTTLQLVAIKDIKEGEEMTFFYPSTEWNMDRAFQCKCGCDNCLGVIKGAKYLSDRIVEKYRFTDFIRRKLDSRRR